MKFLVAFSCLLAIAAATPGQLLNPLAYSVNSPLITPSGYSYSSIVNQNLAPLAYSGYSASPVAYSGYSAAPVAYSGYSAAPVAYSAVAAPVAPVVAAPVAPVVAAPVAYSAPVAVAAVAPVATVEKTQYHAQNEIGQASYGHAEAFQAHDAVQDAAGNKAGSYSYVAPDGQVISASYVADSLGYRVTSNALPVGPSAVPVAPAETVEVVAARIAHLKEHEVASHRVRRSLAVGVAPLAYSAPLVHHAAIPLAYSASVSPVVRPATLTAVVNNPGHAVSYRVD